MVFNASVLNFTNKIILDMDLWLGNDYLHLQV